MVRNKAQEEADAKVVVLLHPDGTEYGSNSPTEINRLHFGQGYKFRDVSSFDEALAFLGDQAAVLGLPAHPAPTGAVTVHFADDVEGDDEGTSTD